MEPVMPMTTMMPMELNEGVDGGNPLTQPVLPPSCLNPLADACDDHEDEIGDHDLYITLCMVACVCVSQKNINFCGKSPFLACESRKMSTFCLCLSVCHLPLYHQDVRCVQCMKMDHLLPLNII